MFSGKASREAPSPDVPTLLGYKSGVRIVAQMRAGMMNLRKQLVVPDKRKGLICVFQTEDTLMRFCWQDRTTGKIELDLLIFRGDTEYVRIPQCTTGRAYVLKIKTPGAKFFFWLQEPKTDKDDEHCKKINDLLNNGPSILSLDKQNANNIDLPKLRALFRNLTRLEKLQLLCQDGHLACYFHRMESRPRPAIQQPNPVDPRVDLSTVVTTDNLSSVLSSPIYINFLQRHLPRLEGIPPEEALRSTLASRQFEYAVSWFSGNLQSGMLNTCGLGLPGRAAYAASQGNMRKFVKVLEKAYSLSEYHKRNEKKSKKKSRKKSQKKTKKDKDDEKM